MKQKIGHYAHQHTTVAAQRKFESQFPGISESTVRAFRSKYRQSIGVGLVSSLLNVLLNLAGRVRSEYIIVFTSPVGFAKKTLEKAQT